MVGRKNQLMRINPCNSKTERKEPHLARKHRKPSLGTLIRITPD
jgi:hypothetical protein